MRNIKNFSLTMFGLFMLVCLSSFNTSIANASVCFLPDGDECAKGDTEGFWPCTGDDCPVETCDSSYNSTQATNKCGMECKQCTVEGDPYYGKYKCPACSCGSLYNSTSAKNDCGDDCEQCTIEGDPNYGKYKCPAENCHCECTINEDKTNENECYFCEQCTDSINCTAEGKTKYKCETDRKCLCLKDGFDSYNQTVGCCFECKESDGYIYDASDIGRSGWSCTECPKPCDGLRKWKCINNNEKDFCIEFNYKCGGTACSDDVIDKIQMTAQLLDNSSIAQTSKTDYKRYCWNFNAIKSYVSDSHDEVTFDVYSIKGKNDSKKYQDGKEIWETTGLEVSRNAIEAYSIFYNSGSDYGSDYQNQFILDTIPYIRDSGINTDKLYAQKYFTVLDSNVSQTYKIDVDVVEKCQLDPNYYYVNPNIIYDEDKFHFDYDEATYDNYLAENVFVDIYGIENKNDLHNHINDWNDYLEAVEFERHCKNNENCEGYYKCSPCFNPEGGRSLYTFAECEQLGKVPGSEFHRSPIDSAVCYYECKKPCTGDYTGTITENDKNCWNISTCQDYYLYKDSKWGDTWYEGETYIDRVENVKDGYVIVDDECVHCSESNAPTRHVSVDVTCHNAVDLIKTEEKIIPGMSTSFGSNHIKLTTDDYGEGIKGNAGTGYYGYVPEFCVDSVIFQKQSGCAAKSVYNFIVTDIKKEGDHDLVYTFEADIPQTAIGKVYIEPRLSVSQKKSHDLLYGDVSFYPYGGGYTVAENGYVPFRCYSKTGTSYNIHGCSLEKEIKAGSSEIGWSGELYPYTQFTIENLFCSYYDMDSWNGGRYALECNGSPASLKEDADDRVMMLKISSNRPIMQDLVVEVRDGVYTWTDDFSNMPAQSMSHTSFDFVSCKSSRQDCGEADKGIEGVFGHLCWYDEAGNGADEDGRYGKCWRDSTSGGTEAMNHDPASTGDSSAQCMCDYTKKNGHGVFTKYSDVAYAFTESGGYGMHYHSFFPLTGLRSSRNYEYKAYIEFKKTNGHPLFGYDHEKENLMVTDDNWIYVLPVDFNYDYGHHNYSSGGWVN